MSTACINKAAALMAAAISLGCGDEGGGQAPAALVVPVACPSPVPSYKSAVAAVVSDHCGRCHTPGDSRYSGINLSTQAKLAAEAQSVDAQVAVGLMPREPDPAFDAAKKLLLRQYLACHAPDN